MNIFDALPGKQRVTIEFVSEEQDYKDVILVVEVAENETHSFSASATQYPIESGVNISDHIIDKGTVYEISGIISDDPIDFLQGGIVDRFTSPFKAKNYKRLDKIKSGKFDLDKPSRRAFAILTAIYWYKLPVNITTKLIRYKNMVMESLTVQRDGKTYRSLNFNAKFRKVRVSKIKWTSNTAPEEVGKTVKGDTVNEGSKNTSSASTGAQDTTAWNIATGVKKAFQ